MESKRKIGLRPKVNTDAKILILGSFPGEDSLKAGEYYANNRNIFWKIIFKILDKKDPNNYEDRIRILQQCGIGLWDVVCACYREGSADSDIVKPKLNEIPEMLKNIASLKAIFINGGKAAKLFNRKFLKDNLNVYIEVLPSTSPANARQTYEYKYSKWIVIKKFL